MESFKDFKAIEPALLSRNCVSPFEKIVSWEKAYFLHMVLIQSKKRVIRVCTVVFALRILTGAEPGGITPQPQPGASSRPLSTPTMLLQLGRGTPQLRCLLLARLKLHWVPVTAVPKHLPLCTGWDLHFQWYIFLWKIHSSAKIFHYKFTALSWLPEEIFSPLKLILSFHCIFSLHFTLRCIFKRLI